MAVQCRVCNKSVVIIRESRPPIVIGGRSIEQRFKHVAVHDDGNQEQVYMEPSRANDLRRELESQCRSEHVALQTAAQSLVDALRWRIDAASYEDSLDTDEQSAFAATLAVLKVLSYG